MLGIPTAAYFIFDWYEDSMVDLPFYGNKTEDGSLHTVPVFHLVDHNGEKITNEALKGHVTVVNYFFTSCPSICPTMTRNMKSVQELYLNDERVKFMSFTVDPKRDDPEKLRKYIEGHAITGNNWTFITGEKKELYRLARNGFLLSATDGDGGPGDFIHSENFVLIDQNGHIRGIYNGTDEGSMGQMMNDIDKLKKEKA
jgi:protein SCO1/2